MLSAFFLFPFLGLDFRNAVLVQPRHTHGIALGFPPCLAKIQLKKHNLISATRLCFEFAYKIIKYFYIIYIIFGTGVI